jgi:hypothetical protein
MNQRPIMKRYMREFILSMIAYAVILIASIYALQNIAMGKPLQTIVALAPAIPVTFVLLAVLRLLKESDELQQRMHLLATSFSAVLTGLITFTYGFLENVGFPKFPTHFVLPLIIALWGFSLAWFSKRYQ